MKFLGEYIEICNTVENIDIKYNIITDKGIEILSEYLIGNMTIKELNLWGNKGITDKSFSNIVKISKSSSIININLIGTLLSFQNQQEINNNLKLTMEQREIPISSNSKSAAKSLSALLI